MPKWACRNRSIITARRPERVQDITPDDCRAEGIELANEGDDWDDAFRRLWDSINLKRGYGWDVNSWVWVLEFKRIEA